MNKIPTKKEVIAYDLFLIFIITMLVISEFGIY